MCAKYITDKRQSPLYIQDQGCFVYPHPRVCVFIDFRERKGERKRETFILETGWLPPILVPTCDRLQLFFFFGSQDDAPTNWDTQQGQGYVLFLIEKIKTPASRQVGVRRI